MVRSPGMFFKVFEGSWLLFLHSLVHLGTDHVIVEARSSDAALHHPPSWTNSSYITYSCVWGHFLVGIHSGTICSTSLHLTKTLQFSDWLTFISFILVMMNCLFFCVLSVSYHNMNLYSCLTCTRQLAKHSMKARNVSQMNSLQGSLWTDSHRWGPHKSVLHNLK